MSRGSVCSWRCLNKHLAEETDKQIKGMLYLPEELTFAAPESPLWQEIFEAMTRPLPPQCPECHEERKGYGCIFPPVPCPHGENDTLEP